jgi:4-amino-4-deoxy-L-arabinose transferase-like glycosyltransferase
MIGGAPPILTRTRVLVLIVGLSVVLRLWAAWAYPAEPAADAADYDELACRIATGLGFVVDDGRATAWRPPGYPALLAGIYSVGGCEPLHAYLMQALLGGLTVALIFWLGAAALGPSEGLVGAALAAAYPGLVWLPRVLLSENLALPLLLLLCLATATQARSHSPAWGVVAGTSLALAALTRPAALFLLPLVAIRYLEGAASGRRLRGLAAFVVCLLVGIAPWLYRNYRTFGRFPVLTTQVGITLYASYWPPQVAGKPIWGNLPGREDPHVAKAYSLGTELDASSELLSATRAGLLAEPTLAFTLWPRKLVAMLAPFDWEWFPKAPGESRRLNVGYLLLIPLALLGAGRLLRRSPWTLILLPLGTLLQTLCFYGSPRFRLLAEPILLLAAAAGLLRLARLDGSRASAREP